MKTLIDVIVSFVRGLLTRQDLERAGADDEALKASATASADLPTFGSSVAADEERARSGIVAFARRQLGEPYAFGAEGPTDADLDRWDCSELIEHAYRAGGGMFIPDGAKYQHQFCMLVREPLPADIGYFGPNKDGIPHVVLYAGEGVCIEARSRRINGEQRGFVMNTPRHEIEAHPRFLGWLRHPDFMRPREDRV